MKRIIFCGVALFTAAAINGQDVQVHLNKTEWTLQEPLRFSIQASPELRLEIAVFSEDTVALYQMAQLSSQEEVFELDMKSFPPNDYTLLVLSDDIRIQKNFILKEN